MVFLATACMGQSGSEVERPPGRDPLPTPIDPGPMGPYVPPTPHCPCGMLRDMQQIRATITAVEDFPQVGQQRYMLRADEILSAAEVPSQALRAGDLFGGYYNDTLACGGMAAPLAVDDEVVAFYRRGLQDGALCCDYIDCTDACRPENDEDSAQRKQEACETSCQTTTASACSEHRDEARLHGDLMLIPWGDELLVGESEFGTATIAPDDLPFLAGNAEACEAGIEDRFEQLTPPPNDTDQSETEAPPPGSSSAQPPPASAVPPGTPTPPPPSTPLPPAEPSAMPAPAPMSGELPTAPPGANASTDGSGGPPPHPEEYRVRCAG